MRIAWLEQSGVLEDRSEVVSALSVAGIDYYRLNWRCDSDPYANVEKTGEKISWSKGREKLYLHSRKLNYDYYIFVDDDITFHSGIRKGVLEIRETLQKYRPYILTIRSDGDWQEKLISRSLTGLVPVFFVDLQFQCYARNVAEFAFPVRFDGGWGTLWYPMLQVNKTPGYVLSHRGLNIFNTRRSADGFYGGMENKNVASIWNRSRPFMGLGVYELSKKIGIKKTIIHLNNMYSIKFSTAGNIRNKWHGS